MVSKSPEERPGTSLHRGYGNSLVQVEAHYVPSLAGMFTSKLLFQRTRVEFRSRYFSQGQRRRNTAGKQNKMYDTWLFPVCVITKYPYLVYPHAFAPHDMCHTTNDVPLIHICVGVRGVAVLCMRGCPGTFYVPIADPKKRADVTIGNNVSADTG